MGEKMSNKELTQDQKDDIVHKCRIYKGTKDGSYNACIHYETMKLKEQLEANGGENEN